MGLPGEARITMKLLRESMSSTQYDVALAYYTNLLKRQVEEDVPDGNSTPRGEPDASPAASASAQFQEGTTVPFVGSSSAPDTGDPAEADGDCLRAEAATWPLRVGEQEVEHIITYHPYARARGLLWKARLQPSEVLAN
jgi:hypothetical protein